MKCVFYQASLIDYGTGFINGYGIVDCLPDNFIVYIDYEAYARDLELSGEVTKFSYDNSTYTVDLFIK
ncbi:MAG TPA: hypothetical protein EYQ43_11530 [Methyloprofundus sp.]|nr:hypothetical protein [Methyloprofundus sp.]HIL78910.1 hypothetical protein [Methylococcales bacterium]